VPFQARSAILEAIGAELGAGVLAYVTGDRENLETEVGADVLRRVPRHLETIGKRDRLALVLYTLGGDTNTQLASEQGADDTALAGDAFYRLADSVHPLALGNVKRSVEQIWQLARKLIRLHMPDADDEALTDLVMRLTTELYSHSHLITRSEAAALGLPVEEPSDELESLLLAYYDRLKDDLELLEKFDPGAMLRAQQQPQLPVVLERAYIETADTCDTFVTRGVIAQQSRMEITNERWEVIA
jgi:hypothetical protein